MEEYNKLISEVNAKNVPQLGKDTYQRDYLIKLYTLNPPLPPKVLISCIFSDTHKSDDHVNLVSGEMVINGVCYPLSQELKEVMDKYRARMRERSKSYDPEYIFPMPSGKRYTSNNVGMFFKKVFGVCISDYTKLYYKKEIEMVQKSEELSKADKETEEPHETQAGFINVKGDFKKTDLSHI